MSASHDPVEQSSAPEDPEAATVPLGFRLAAWFLAALGFLASTYLTYEHFTASTTLACPDTGAVNCAKVTSSSYSTVAGVPVALLGLVFFAAITPLLLPKAWSDTRPGVHRARLVLVTVGVGFVLYLVWAELFRIHAICLWCTAVHAITVLLFAAVVFAEAVRPSPSTPPS